jgi:hypothetical protein
MKTLPCLITIGSLWIIPFASIPAAETTNAPTPSIGVYDSRAVAYAYLVSAPYQKDIQEKVRAAQAAKQAGDSAKLKELDAVLKAEQAQGHRQVFSTAPPIAAMERIKDRLPEIQKQAGVSVIVSKWDEATLQKYKAATRVEVTDKLVREFIQPDEKQSQIISSIEKSEPISLEKCDEMIRKGEI